LYFMTSLSTALRVAAHGKTAVLPFYQTIYAFLASMQIDVALFGLGLREGLNGFNECLYSINSVVVMLKMI
jgi:hypothetical protein